MFQRFVKPPLLVLLATCEMFKDLPQRLCSMLSKNTVLEGDARSTRRFSTWAVILLLCPLLASPLSAWAQTNTSSNLVSMQSGSATSAKTLTLTLPPAKEVGTIGVLAVLYTNSRNNAHISVTGLGATWTPGYHAAGSSMGIQFIYGQHFSGGGTTVTITVPNTDTLVATFSGWNNLTIDEDADSQAFAIYSGVSPQISSTTSDSDTVVFAVTAYQGAALASPPQGDFVPLDAAASTVSPGFNLIGGYQVASATGTYTNQFLFNTSSHSLSVSLALESSGVNELFAATPLTDFAAGQLYLGNFPGFLYSGSNTMSAAHDSDGRSAAEQIQPLDADGNPSPTGKIAVVGIGMRNWTLELCTGTPGTLGCSPYTFGEQAGSFPGVNPQMVLVDCAQGGTFATDWATVTPAWNTCLKWLSLYGVTAAQVQVVLWKQIDASPKISLSSLSVGSTCPANPNPATAPDACVYEALTAEAVRTVKTKFPNTQQMFLQSRTYAGYANYAESPEPYAYEYGFSTKWLIQAQINQLATGHVDPVAGNLSYSAAPWLAWGPYFWASGPTPRSDGQTWLGGDFADDGTHISTCPFYGINCGVKQIADLMINFYSTSPYTTWFLAP